MYIYVLSYLQYLRKFSRKDINVLYRVQYISSQIDQHCV